VEAVGFEEMNLKSADRASAGDWRRFLPLIVTNPTLYAGTFDADKVGMSNRRLAEGHCEFTPVPLVRFRKSLAMHYPASGTRHSHRSSSGKASLAKERTVLVTDSAALAESLKTLDVAGPRDGGFGRKRFGLNS
jgi:hypothetical protein